MTAKKKGPTVSENREVQLIGIPHFLQGDADGLCVYYSMSMMVSALRPEWMIDIHEAPRWKNKGGPIFQVFKGIVSRKNADFNAQFTSWFFGGIGDGGAKKILNGLFQKKSDKEDDRTTYFVSREVKRRRAPRTKQNPQKKKILKKFTVGQLFKLIDEHLPVMIGGGGLGDHTVLAIGYAKYIDGNRCVIYYDPGESRVSIRHVREVFRKPVDAIIPVSKRFLASHRPDKVVCVGDKSQLIYWKRKQEG